MEQTFQKFLIDNFKIICVIFLICFIALLSASVYAQDPAQYGTPYAGVPDTRDINMYQAQIRPYSAAGNLAGVTARLDQIKALGTNVIYLMPHYPNGTDSRSSASPYCVKDLKAVGSEYGNLNDLRTLVEQAHNKGMAVILDMVVNQTSWDHAWITQHPEYYVKNPDGTIFALYPDVAKLDFNNSALHAELISAMRYWIFAANVDGYRCDYANNAPVSFWTAAINNLRGITSHKILMMAEGDRLENFQAGFDMNFGDKWFHDAIEEIAHNGAPLSNIQNTTNTEYTYANSTQQVVRYTANHDTQTNDNGDFMPFKIFTNHNGIVANFLVSAYMRGVPMLTSGQEIDYNAQMMWPWNNFKFNWTQNTGAAADFTKIFNFRTSSVAIRRGTMTNYSNNDVCAFTKISGTDKVVVMTNLRNASKTFVIPAALAGTYKDAYSGANVTLTEGATQSFAAFQYIVLTNATVQNVAVTGVTVSPTSATLSVGATLQLTATVAPANATNKAVTWTSSNTSLASVNASGLVTAVAAGTATITVKTTDGNKTATSAITVNTVPPVAVTGVTLNQTTATLNAGATLQLTATIAPANATNKAVTWTSSNTAFATVSASGLVTAIAAGTATITVKTTDGNKTATCAVTVSAGGATTYYQILNRWQANTYLYDGGTGQLKYGTSPSGNSYQWAKVDAGSGFFLLKNRATGNLMHVENQNGSVQVTAANATWYSAMWSLPATGDGWSYIQNRWQSGNKISIENLAGYAQYNGTTGWYSAMWQLVNPQSGRQAAEETSIKLTAGDIEVYPNPATGKQLNISISGIEENEMATVTIHDINGKIAMETRMHKTAKIEHQLPVGFYILRVRANSINAIKKLVIE